jgi:hypothetical protein
MWGGRRGSFVVRGCVGVVAGGARVLDADAHSVAVGRLVVALQHAGEHEVERLRRACARQPRHVGGDFAQRRQSLVAHPSQVVDDDRDQFPAVEQRRVGSVLPVLRPTQETPASPRRLVGSVDARDVDHVRGVRQVDEHVAATGGVPYVHRDVRRLPAGGQVELAECPPQ